MKKLISCFLVILMVMISCASFADEVQLNSMEKMLYSALLTASKKYFYSPSSVRVIEVGGLNHRSLWERDEGCEEWLPWLVSVKLQGDNRLGGSTNDYYIICIKSGAPKTSEGKSKVNEYKDIVNKHYLMPSLDISLFERSLMELEAQVGDCMIISSSPYFLSANINERNVNLALKAYWDDMGF